MKKKKRSNTKKKSGVKIPAFSKRRGKQIYELTLSPRARTEQDIKEIINLVSFNAMKNVDEFARITFLNVHGKDIASLTQVEYFEFETRKEFFELIKDFCDSVNYTMWRRPTPKTSDSWKRMYKLRHYLRRIIIDFENVD